MANHTDDPVVGIEEVPVSLSATEAQIRGEVDVQIATANRYPRSIKRFLNEAKELATLDDETAASCFYALPRDGKAIEGPSARLAEIVASAWGNMRVEGKPISEDDKFVMARGVAWDLQRNVAIAFESRRRITDKRGRKFKDDMIAVTANAATSIAIRNAVFKVVPSAFWRPIYQECRKVAIGTQETLVNRRAKMLEHFSKMGVVEARVLELLDVQGVEDITLEHMATLRGLATAIKDGDTSIDEAFGPSKAPRRTSLEKPTNYDQWVDDIDKVADEGKAAFQDAWAQSADTHRKYLAATEPDRLESMKARAAKVKEHTS